MNETTTTMQVAELSQLLRAATDGTDVETQDASRLLHDERIDREAVVEVLNAGRNEPTGLLLVLLQAGYNCGRLEVAAASPTA